MTRLFVCIASQLMFVTLYGSWAVFRPEEAFAWMPPFVAVVFAIVIYNNWEPIKALVRMWRR